MTGHFGFGSRIQTTLTGGGRSVVGNTTIGFCVASIVGAAIAGGFIAAGYSPWFALAGLAVPYLPYFLFFHGTLRHAAEHPDSAVTSEEHYARVIETRAMAAKDASLVRVETPILGGSREVMEAASSAISAGDGNE